MFGRKPKNDVAPTQNPTLVQGPSPVRGLTLAASSRASIAPNALILVHSRGQGSSPSHKALMARAIANPPARTNSVLAQGLATRGVASFASSATPLTNAVASPAPNFADPAKG